MDLQKVTGWWYNWIDVITLHQIKPTSVTNCSSDGCSLR